jgi:flagellar basal-body rod modification protein FlgD
MEVSNNTQSSSQPTHSTPTDSDGALNYDSFLKLLLAQMKNQDPTSPTDSTEWVAQFATFTQVEQSMMTNQNLQSMLSQIALSQADGIIGRTITSADGTVTGEVKSVHIVSGGAVAELGDGKFVLLEPGVEIS